MIIDSHAYCFPPGDDPAGYSTTEERLAWLQISQGLHHQPAWRVRDRAPASSDGLGEETPSDWSNLPDVNFRIDNDRGRVVWTIDGEDHTKQFFPPNLRNLAFSPHSLIAEMDYNNVDMALLHTNPMLGRDSAYLAKCVHTYPNRLRAMAPVDEWRILSDTDAVISEVTTAIQTHGLHAIKFNTRPAYSQSPEPWDDGNYRPFWQAVSTLNVPIFFTLGAGPGTAAGATTGPKYQAGYLEEQQTLIAWMNRYPHLTCSLTHGFPWRIFLENDRIILPNEVWLPFENPNVNLEVCFPVRIGDLFDYPYPQIWPTLEQMVERIGANRLLWGTDMPFQNRFCTYRQSRAWIEKYCTFLSKEDLNWIMGGTAKRILDI
ncbi:MAG: amidohydrolase family protein [Candidatus Latescibacteria bacterium]|jgi:predicted TIM-barrel fold metal-dependent hydrolase|nr:amidohydrolase family protein [Candidatus Latescibacterota bacterium]